ncbi:MAG: MMPL family transporter [Dehalococcoidia bacterium]
MFAALARFSYRHRWPVLIAFLLLFPLAGVYGGGAFSALKPGGFDDPGAESFKATELLRNELDTGSADLIALYTVDGHADDPATRSAITGALDHAAQDPAVERVTSYYSTGSAQFLSEDGSHTFAVISLDGDDAAQEEAAERIEPLLRVEGASVQFGGAVPAGTAINAAVETGLTRAEMIAFPITAVLLFFIFGSLVSAAVPLLLGALAILLSLATLRLIAGLTDVSIFAVNIVTVMGLGLAIDYALFILNRYREELPRLGVEGALVRAVSTTGRAVAFSGITVAASLIGLFVFPQMFLRSMAIGGIAVATITIIINVTLLPALIAVLGQRIDAIRLPWRRRQGAEPAGRDGGFWHRVAFGVMRRPVLVAAAVVGFLLLLGTPFLNVRASTPDARVLDADVEARRVSNVLATEFLPNQTTPHEIAVTTRGDALTPENIGALYDYTQQIAALPGITRVDSIFSLVPGQSREAYQSLYSQPAETQDPRLAAGLAAYASGPYTRIAAVSAGTFDAPQTQAQVDAIRALPAPAGASVLVGGSAAGLTDLLDSIITRGPLMLGVIGVVMFAVLFLVFGSVTLPLKAMVMNLLSLTASFGAMVWIFQDGRFEGLLRYDSLGNVNATQPLLMFAVVFGLSMDYEVLLLSRVREEYVKTGENTLAVARGLEKTGRLITSAAALLVVVFLAFATSSIVFMKELGIGVALAVAIDATVVRALLVPATMKLMGRWNWWSPAPLTRLWQRIGLGDLEGHGSPRIPQGVNGD